jgi:hypothetical protein
MILEISAKQMKKSIEKIYAMLDEVSPVDFDCGKLCGQVCCLYDEDDCPNKDLVLYLFPGEELMYEDNDSFDLFYLPSKEVNYPHTWDDDVFLVECKTPPNCDRKIRPIQCRTFPLIPHITKDNKFHLIFDENEFPYECPIIRDNIKLNDDFIQVTYKVWNILIKDPMVYDLVEYDSRMRENRRKEYTIII